MKRLFFLYILSLAVFAATPAYSLCVADLVCDHVREPGGALQFILLEDVGGGPFIEVARGPLCDFPAVPYDGVATFIACAQEGADIACDTLTPLTLACLM